MKKFYVDEELVSEEEFYSRLENESNTYVEDNYDDLIDELNEPYQVGCLTFNASQVLYQCDPIAYRCGLSDKQSSKLEELQYEIENYYECSINGCYFRIEEDEEE